MNQLKRALVATGASLALAVGAAGVASADAMNQCSSGFELSGGKCIAIDNSENTTTNTDYTVNGNCSAIISTGDSNAETAAIGGDGEDGGNGGMGVHGDGGDGGAGGSGGSVSASTGADSGVNFNPSCNTTNVTNLTQETRTITAATAATATTAVAKSSANVAPVAQVQAPTGGVGAGEGGAVSSALAPVIALGGSVATLGAGVVRLRKSGLGLTV